MFMNITQDTSSSKQTKVEGFRQSVFDRKCSCRAPERIAERLIHEVSMR